MNELTRGRCTVADDEGKRPANELLRVPVVWGLACAAPGLPLEVLGRCMEELDTADPGRSGRCCMFEGCPMMACREARCMVPPREAPPGVPGLVAGREPARVRGLDSGPNAWPRSNTPDASSFCSSGGGSYRPVLCMRS